MRKVLFPMTAQKNPEKILQDYEKKADEIVMQMFNILERAQRKTDDEKYRNALNKLQK